MRPKRPCCTKYSRKWREIHLCQYTVRVEWELKILVRFLKTNKQNVIQETKWDQVSGIIQQPDHSTGGLTSSSFSFLKHRHAALLLKPSPSYVLVWLGLNFIIYIIKCGTGKTLRRKEAVPAESAERKSGVSRWGNEATPADWRDSHSSVHKKWSRPVRTRAVLRCGWGSAGKWSGAVFISDLRTDLSASHPPPPFPWTSVIIKFNATKTDFICTSRVSFNPTFCTMLSLSFLKKKWFYRWKFIR